ncbi:src-like-adapter isoform X1 [Silurus asotus]|uniref:Src-like-adapter isoform X1 n=1 Tax=Silurus asotus TaxID=30991 RepID=A0AAD5FJM0_SILAS|nr:src-like-adapter isoform X1 [Silurus asotus]
MCLKYVSCLTVCDKEPAVVLNDYPPPTICEPLFRTGDWLRLVSDEGYWVKVYSLQTKAENYIPRCHVAKVYHGWLFEGVARQKAEELLQLPGNRVGSFMIRESRRGVYSLSVRHRSIMHYRILRLPNNWYFISPRLTFQCLEDLVNHYSDIADGLCCILTGPCLAAPEPVRISQSSIVRSHNQTAVRRMELDQQNITTSSAQRESYFSAGVQDSVSSYLSLVGVQEKKRHSWRGKKWKSINTFPRNQEYSMVTEEDDEEEEY